jgi:NAD(P)H-hydrate repair Nnr-like enzyme with NAD(P)H-hydrate dehydratase domain
LTALVVGPGLASPKLPATLKAAVVERWMNAPFPVVADASALDWIGETRFPELRVVTPHPGEAARLLGIATSVVQADRPGALRALSRRFGGCHVVLKGHETLTGRATGLVAVNGSGNPGLAQGGAGDLLAGFIGGCLAGNPLNADLAVAVGFAVWEHGAAADRLGRNRRRFAMEDLAIELGQWDGNTLPPAGPIC